MLSTLNKWSKHILMAIPLLIFAPTAYFASKPTLCAYVMLWMAMYWLSAVLPLPVTSMMPLVLFPLLDILSTEETASAYFDEVGATVFASVVFAVALEKTGLATRVALRMLYAVGTSFSSLLFVFMLGTALLSMLFSNTATTAIVAPVVAALIEQMKCQTRLKRHTSSRYGSLRVSPARSVAEVYRKAEARLQASLVGRFPSAPSLTPVTWMLANVPTTFACLLAAWLCSYRRLRHIVCDKADHLKATENKTRREVERRNQELGRIGCGELAVVLLLVLLVYLWLFKSRDSILGWMKLLPLDAKPGASTTLLMVVVPLFAIPRSRQRSARGNPMRPYDPILSWREMSSMCHWNLMFLVSGSLTFSKASRASGLSDVIMYWLDNLEGLDQTLVATILSLLAATVTEFFSNAAVVSMLIPIVLETAVKFRMHPMTLAMPVTLSCSFAFTLPASTPPNALVYDMASMGVRDMIWPGLHLTLICVSITVLLTSTLGRFVLDVGEFPEWASDNVTSPSQLTV